MKRLIPYLNRETITAAILEGSVDASNGALNLTGEVPYTLWSSRMSYCDSRCSAGELNLSAIVSPTGTINSELHTAKGKIKWTTLGAE